MQRSIRRSAVFVLAAVALCLGGCELKSFKVWIPDFDSSQVRGLWIYQQGISGAYERVMQLVFTEPFYKDGAEVLMYTADEFIDEDGKQVHVEAQVLRNRLYPDHVTLRLWLPCEPPLAIRVSTYNDVGESPLSDDALYLLLDSPSSGTNATAS